MREKSIGMTRLFVVTILLASLLDASVAYADFDLTQVTTGYADGYTGADAHFHAWEHRSDAESFRVKFGDNYHPWRHDDSRHKDHH